MKDEKYLIELGKRIAELRKKKDWTQVEFAEKLKIQRTALTRIELGKVNSTINTLRNISKTLGIPVDELVRL
jgi:transcriptional regulator with XRE-family HTH domain